MRLWRVLAGCYSDNPLNVTCVKSVILKLLEFCSVRF
jgi:hypothetical protein